MAAHPTLALTHPDCDCGAHLALMMPAVIEIPQQSSRSARTPRYQSWNLRTVNIYAAMLQSRCGRKQEKVIRSVQDTNNVWG